jgi:hypothetical protein
MGDDRANVYTDGDLTIYRASSFGGCTRQLAALRMGYEPAPTPASSQAIFDAGSEAEDKAIVRLIKMGYRIGLRQKEYDLKLTNRIILRVHPDGETLVNSPHLGVLEIKSQNQDAWDDFDRKGWESRLWPKYKWQVSAEMIASGKQGVVVRINRDDEDCALDVMVIEKPFHSLADLRRRALTIEQIAYKGSLPDACDRPSFPCPVYRLHTDTLDLAVGINDENIDQLAVEYDKARGMVKRWEGIRDTARRALRLGIVDEKIKTRSGIVVSFSQSVSKRLSQKKLTDAGIDITGYMDETITERIDVRMPKEVDDVAPAEPT